MFELLARLCYFYIVHWLKYNPKRGCPMKKTVSLILVFILAFSCAVLPAQAAGTEEKATDYPFVLIHGMLGWGENSQNILKAPYFGYEGQYVVPDELRAKGYTVAVPTVGPVSSAWDRACEMFAQLTGTVVDYGAAHSAKYGHARFGRDYTGKAMLSADWYKTGKINLVAHSFGGATVRIFSSLLAFGDADEIAASPDDCSPLFKGGYPDCIYSILTLQSPNNGVPLCNIANDTVFPVFVLAYVCHLLGMQNLIAVDSMLDQWGLTCDNSTGKLPSFNLSGVFAMTRSKDHCGYDMSLQGAKEINEKYRMNESIYYYSNAAAIMKESAIGITVPAAADFMIVPAMMGALLAGGTYGGIKTDRSWAVTDGVVPVPSALYPEGQPHADYDSSVACEKGIWYVLPVATGTHSFGVGNGDMEKTWEGFLEMLDSPKAQPAAELR